MSNIVLSYGVVANRKECSMLVYFGQCSQYSEVLWFERYDVLLRQLYGSRWPECVDVVRCMFHDVLTHPDSELIVGMFTVQRELIGVAQATYSRRLPEYKVYVNSVVVDERYRGEGLGAELMAEVHRQVETRWPQAKSIELTSSAKRNTQRFYTDLGYLMRTKESQDETIVYVKNL